MLKRCVSILFLMKLCQIEPWATINGCSKLQRAAKKSLSRPKTTESSSEMPSIKREYLVNPKTKESGGGVGGGGREENLQTPNEKAETKRGKPKIKKKKKEKRWKPSRIKEKFTENVGLLLQSKGMQSKHFQRSRIEESSKRQVECFTKLHAHRGLLRKRFPLLSKRN